MLDLAMEKENTYLGCENPPTRNNVMVFEHEVPNLQNMWKLFSFRNWNPSKLRPR
jgi:hypothetical protein